MSYIVFSVAGLVRNYIKHLSGNALMIIERDLKREIDAGNHGMEMDLKIWNALLIDIDKERKSRL